MKLEEAGRAKAAAKFIRIPLIIHTVLKRENSLTLQVEHVQVRRTSISIPKDALKLRREEIEDYIKQVYPNAHSFVIQYESRGDEMVPFCAQLFLSPNRRPGSR